MIAAESRIVTTCRIHTDPDNLMQVIYQIIAAYFEDDCADELTKDPVMNAFLEKDKLASQPTLLNKAWREGLMDLLFAVFIGCLAGLIGNLYN